MARSRALTRPAGPNEAASYLAKSEEFLRAAQDSLGLGNNTAAVGNSVHAGILAADAIAAVRSRAVWRGEHAQAPAHLDAAGEDGKQAARHLRRLLPLKTRAEYDPDPIGAADAKSAVSAAARMVAIARQSLTSVPMPADKTKTPN
ncbi:MAG TPA: hypothetical protein VME46_20155 [Acidimicrobiales bacterium]|nr:hypothetical protein [Acidimicrobiales bacterium]